MAPFQDRPPDSTIFERNWLSMAIVLIAVVGSLIIAFVPAESATAVIKFLAPVIILLGIVWRQKQTHDLVVEHGEKLNEIHSQTNATVTVAVAEAKMQNQAIGQLHQEVKGLREDIAEKGAP